MVKSEIKKHNGRLVLAINGEIMPACAYITYFTERNCYADFCNCGYQIFSVNVAFSSLPWNSSTGCEVLEGIFENPDYPDYSPFDDAMDELLKTCPNAYVFPRVYITMPRQWVAKHPEETFDTMDGNRRELLFSEAFRHDGGELLKKFIRHTQNASYAEHIMGYQISGGQTQEWFHFFGEWRIEQVKAAMQALHMEDKYTALFHSDVLPDMNSLRGTGEIEDICTKQYLEFLNYSVAETVAYFTHIAKEETKRQQIIGAFYGYTLEVIHSTWGTHALEQLLDCPDIDFFCSPLSYAHNRKLGIDSVSMVAENTVQLHGKMYILECDVRTCLSDYPGNCRAGFDPKGLYREPIWIGPETVEKSASAMRKTYARQLVRQNGLWWFDMWGGWYADKRLMEEAERCNALMVQDVSENKAVQRAEVALYVDETVYRRMHSGQPCAFSAHVTQISLGQSGVPYETYLLCDFNECVNYRAVILPVPYDSPRTLELKELCHKHGIPVLQATPEKYSFTPEELRKFLCESGVWCYCKSDDVFGIGNGYFYIHASEGGEKEIKFPHKCRILDLCDAYAKEEYTDIVRVSMQQHETLIFKIM